MVLESLLAVLALCVAGAAAAADGTPAAGTPFQVFSSGVAGFFEMFGIPVYIAQCFIECRKCGNRFLSLQTMKYIPCPDCEQEIDYEIGPDESLEDVLDTAELLQKIEGEEEVEKMDALLSLAITGGDCNWI